MFVPTLEDKGALKSFGNRFLNKCGGVCHFHSLPLQFKKKRIEKRIRQEKEKQSKIRVDLLIHWIDYLLYDKKLYLEIKRGVIILTLVFRLILHCSFVFLWFFSLFSHFYLPLP